MEITFVQLSLTAKRFASSILAVLAEKFGVS